jgi:hypothetical protein
MEIERQVHPAASVWMKPEKMAELDAEQRPYN